MAKAALDSDKDWIAWGENDPFWAVATFQDREKSGSKPWTPEEFYAQGTAAWADHRRAWLAYGLTPGGTCLEIGCGAGRLTQALAKEFDRVHGLDVSPGMLDTARRYVHAPNITYHLTSGTRVPSEVGLVDAVLSTYVFQHLDHVSDGVDYLRSIFGVMRPGATLMVQMPLYALPPVKGRLGRSLRTVGEAQVAGVALLSRVKSKVRRLRQVPVMQHLTYEMGELQAAMLELGYVDVQFTYVSPSVQWLFARHP